jgi:DNA-directed RNA polymerase specialized sigma24 family protein
MSLFRPKSAESWTRERLFAEKYDWLLGCALRLVNGDQAVAEDLVQESFLQFVLAKMELKSTENIEPLLYTNLKFVHLAYLRRLQRYPYESLPLAEYDFLELALRANASIAERVEVQNTLRRIVAYICWRKESAKSASVLILRYFHGYYPDEIVRIAQTTRQSVDRRLQDSRKETSLYVSSPDRLRIMHQPKPPELTPSYSSLPSEQLIPELKRAIFASCRTECLTEEALRKRYQKKIAGPIERELLAHIVSCERCLSLVNRFCGINPPTDRYLEETLGRDPNPRTKNKKDASMSSNIGRALRIAWERFREVYEHEPRQLNIVVNGSVLATQDVNSVWNRQEVKLGPEVRPEYIQVISEQDICLLAMHVDSATAEVEQEIHHEIDLSNGRQIRARLRFTTVGVLVQVAYYAPEESNVSESECELDEMEEAESAAHDSKSQDIENEADPSRPSWSRLWGRLPRLHLPEMTPALAAAGILVLIFMIAGGFWLKSRLSTDPNQLLARAVVANTEGTSSATPGVIRQKVRIRTSKRSLERTIYRDAQGRRQPKTQELSTEDAQLQVRLATADVNWDNPLSADNFKVWHDSGLITHDEVTRSGDGLLTLTTTAASGSVARESLSIRERDFHPIDRLVEFRNAETVEIAEVDYSVLPWGAPTEQFFDPLSRNTVSDAAPNRLPLLPLTQTELDEAELRARLALNQLHADTDLHVAITRTGAGIRVRAFVEDAARKRVMEARLRPLPNVIAEIYTFAEMERAPQPKAPSTLRLYESVAESSPIQHYLSAKGWAPDRAADLSSQILNVSVVVYSESKTLDDLSRRFGPPNQLADSAANLLDQLIDNHTAALMTALGREDALLAEAGLSSVSTSAAVPSFVAPLADLGQRNRSLCERLALTEAGSEENTSPESIAPELRLSIVQTRAAASRMSAALDNLNRFNAAR